MFGIRFRVTACAVRCLSRVDVVPRPEHVSKSSREYYTILLFYFPTRGDVLVNIEHFFYLNILRT